jgi:hypothetical protein
LGRIADIDILRHPARRKPSRQCVSDLFAIQMLDLSD